MNFDSNDYRGIIIHVEKVQIVFKSMECILHFNNEDVYKVVLLCLESK